MILAVLKTCRGDPRGPLSLPLPVPRERAGIRVHCDVLDQLYLFLFNFPTTLAKTPLGAILDATRITLLLSPGTTIVFPAISPSYPALATSIDVIDLGLFKTFD